MMIFALQFALIQSITYNSGECTAAKFNWQWEQFEKHYFQSTDTIGIITRFQYNVMVRRNRRVASEPEKRTLRSSTIAFRTFFYFRVANEAKK